MALLRQIPFVGVPGREMAPAGQIPFDWSSFIRKAYKTRAKRARGD
jgi:hypothetical protein